MLPLPTTQMLTRGSREDLDVPGLFIHVTEKKTLEVTSSTFFPEIKSANSLCPLYTEQALE